MSESSNFILRAQGVGSDLEAIEGNCVSVTPIHLDLTNYAALRALRKWTW